MQLASPLLAMAVAAVMVGSAYSEPMSTSPPTPASEITFFNASAEAASPPMCQCLFNAVLQQNELVCKSRQESEEEDADLSELVDWSCQYVKIDISNLDINFVSRDAFTSRPGLTIIHLYSDFIEQIDAEAFRGLKSLAQVDLSDNSLLSVDSQMFVNNRELKTVSLADNPLVELKPNTPILESESITSLDLSFCKLKTLTMESFAKLPNLERLDLSSNDIETLPMVALQPLLSLNAFNIGNNRWNCDCALKEVVKFAKKMQVTDARVRCYGLNRTMEYWTEKTAQKYCSEILPEIEPENDVYELSVSEPDDISFDYFSANKEQIIVTVLGVVVGFVVFVVFVVLMVRRTAPQRRNRIYRTSISSTLLIPEPKASIVRQTDISRVSSGDNVNGHHYEQIR